MSDGGKNQKGFPTGVRSHVGVEPCADRCPRQLCRTSALLPAFSFFRAQDAGPNRVLWWNYASCLGIKTFCSPAKTSRPQPSSAMLLRIIDTPFGRPLIWRDHGVLGSGPGDLAQYCNWVHLIGSFVAVVLPEAKYPADHTLRRPPHRRLLSSHRIIETASQADAAITMMVVGLSIGNHLQQITAKATRPQHPSVAPAESILAAMRPRCVPSEPTLVFFSIS